LHIAGSMAPQRQSEMANIVLRALISGIFVSILNASVAGQFYFPLLPNQRRSELKVVFLQ